jgi:radical SAM superfamily enzyme YgiQ (UPF0313 family)
MKILWPVHDLHKGDNQFVGIMIMASLLKQHGHDSEVVDADFSTISKKIGSNSDIIVAYSMPTLYFQLYLRLNRQLKNKHTFYSIFGGPHPTYFPEMIYEEGVDCVCVGEGEYPMLELAQGLADHTPIHDIQNLWIKKDNGIYKNPVRPLIEDLDRLPLPDHNIFRKAIPHTIWKAVVMTSRGCPYQCSYCYNHSYQKLYKGKGTLVRRRSVQNVIQELQLIRKHKCYQYIQILDDLFTLSPDWVKEFSDSYKKYIDIPFSCLARADYITEDIVNNLKRAGCCRILLGIETGDEYLRKNVLKRNMSNESIINAAHIIKKSGIKLMTANILGIPGGSFESDLKTWELNARIKPDYAGVNLMQPYHGTDIHEYAKQNNLLSMEESERNETKVSKYSTIRYTDNIEKKKAENFQKLFPFAVSVPFLIPLIKVLIQLPQNKLYYLLFSLQVNYYHYFRIIPARIGIKNLIKRNKFYWSLVNTMTKFNICKPQNIS